ncbi:MAG: saccharopine dehydrogenase family protein [Pseudomonadota bacterium]
MTTLLNPLILGAGGVGSVMAHKAAQNNAKLGAITIATRSRDRADRVVSEIERRGNRQSDQFGISTRTVDAKDVSALAALIRETGARIVLNASSTHTHLAVMEACLETGAHYLDTSVYEKEGEENAPAPWYANYEWKLKDRFRERGVTALLSIGFDPGVVNVFCRKVLNDYVDEIDTIDILDVNGGSHGRYFATNFNPEINLREIMEEVVYWENGDWARIPPHSKAIEYDFPVLGRHKLYSVGHDELHSLYRHVPAQRIEFWMGFNDHYLKVFGVLNNLGLLSSVPVDVEGTRIAPLKMIKAVLPDPATLAKGYTGSVCIGCRVAGRHNGTPRTVFIYSTCDHEACYRDVGSQAISYTTGVPAVAAALTLADGPWNVGHMVNVEELDPDPYLDNLARIGIDWQVRDDPAGPAP